MDMKRKKKSKIEKEPTTYTVQGFVDYYNKNIPDSFPRATKDALDRFKIEHPALFKEDKKWQADKHRKRLMDWLATHSNN